MKKEKEYMDYLISRKDNQGICFILDDYYMDIIDFNGVVSRVLEVKKKDFYNYTIWLSVNNNDKCPTD